MRSLYCEDEDLKALESLAAIPREPAQMELKEEEENKWNLPIGQLAAMPSAPAKMSDEQKDKKCEDNQFICVNCTFKNTVDNMR